MKMEIPKIVQTTRIKKSANDIYEVLTTAEGWNSWFTDETEIISMDGDEKIKLVWTNWGSENLTLSDGGRIVKKVQNKAFAFEWSPAKGLTTTVSFELEEGEEGTLVTVVESGYSENHLDTLVHCAAGWGEALTLLKAYMHYNIKLRG
jgi:uncharacterized protein YndB with AHSA1/START domain